MWEVKLKLQRTEDSCTAAEEKTLCLESFVREGLGSIGRVLLCHMTNSDSLKFLMLDLNCMKPFDKA